MGANIEQDKEIVKTATIAKNGNRFSLSEFMEEVRAIMGVPEWFLYEDSRKTKGFKNDKCVQIEIYFSGPHANRLEQDFNRLLASGRQASPSIQIPGYVPDPKRKTKLSYKECNSGKKKGKSLQELERTPKNSDLSSAASSQPRLIAVIVSSLLLRCL